MFLVSFLNIDGCYYGVFDANNRVEAAKAALENLIETQKTNLSTVWPVDFDSATLKTIDEEVYETILSTRYIDVQNIVGFVSDNNIDLGEGFDPDSVFIVTVEEYKIGTMIGPADL